MDGLLDPRSDLGVSSDDQSSSSAHGRGTSSTWMVVCHTCLPLIDALIGQWEADPVVPRPANCESCGRGAGLLVNVRPVPAMQPRL